jgi:heavy metal sensor kinase
VLKASPLPPGLAQPARDSIPEPVGEQHLVRQQGPVRELFLRGPGNTLVLVGRSIQHELNQLRWLRGQLAMTGLGVLAVGLAGGWFLSGRAFRPIASISSTAAAISAASLSRRIDVKEVDSELGKLASVLNSMFARLEEAFARQVRFTGDASHELRTPLAIIQTHAELALSRPRSPEEYQEALDACVRASRRMKGIVEALLTLARADSGKLELKCQRFDLGTLVCDTVALIEPLAAQKNISLSVSAPQVEMVADPTRLAQVLTNLVTNAIGYNHPGGKVWVTLETKEREAVLQVADTGCGIPEEDQAHVFERFYRADKARSREQGGSGLGLAISRSIVEAMGGSISFTTQLNEGTIFVVRLPLLGSQAEPQDTPS